MPESTRIPLAPGLAAWLTAEAQRAGLDVPTLIQVILLQAWESAPEDAPPPRLQPHNEESEYATSE